MKSAFIAALIASLATCPARAQHPGGAERHTTSVTGDAVVRIKPDKIAITFGIETFEEDIRLAKENNDVIMKETIAAMKECGVQQKNIRTDYLSIQPQWEDKRRWKGKPAGYLVRNTLVVIVKDADKIDGVVTGALISGVNYIQGIDFQTTELKKHREQAREMAVRAAKEKADKITGVLNHTVGPAIQIREQSGARSSHLSSWYGWGGSRSGASSQNTAQVDSGDSDAASDTIALGKITITARVFVTFELNE